MIVVELLRRLEADPLLGDDLLEVERFAERAAEVLPHGRRDPLALLKGKLRVGERKIAQRALLPIEEGGDEPPGEARAQRHGFERQRRRGCLSSPEYDIFQPVTQGLVEGHSAARYRRAAEAADCDGP